MKTLFLHNIRKSSFLLITYCFLLVLEFVYSGVCSGLFVIKDTEWFYQYCLININISLYIASFVAAIEAIVLFSYLQHSRSCMFFHSLPLKREKILLNNLGSGLTVMFSVNLPAYIINVIISACNGISTVREMGVWLAVICIEELVLFAFLCFLIMGNTIALNGIKYVAASVGGLIAGSFFTFIAVSDLFDYSLSSRYSGTAKLFIVIGFMIFGFIFYALTMMLIEKSKSAFTKYIKSNLVFALAMAVVGVGVLCLSRYRENYIPPKEDIETVFVNNRALWDSNYLNDTLNEEFSDYSMFLLNEKVTSADEGLLDEFLELHRMIISVKESALENNQQDFRLRFAYKMSDESMIYRGYYCDLQGILL